MTSVCWSWPTEATPDHNVMVGAMHAGTKRVNLDSTDQVSLFFIAPESSLHAHWSTLWCFLWCTGVHKAVSSDFFRFDWTKPLNEHFFTALLPGLNCVGQFQPHPSFPFSLLFSLEANNAVKANYKVFQCSCWRDEKIIVNQLALNNPEPAEQYW